MLERFAAQVLNKYIGQYVENFNPQNLSIGIVQGAVELENLKIRKDALKEFDLPGIGVKWGFIGKITLRVPSYRNYSEPWVIDINKLHLIIGPCANDTSNVDEELEQSAKKEKKDKKLAQLEERWYASQGSSKSIYAIWRSYSSSIVTNIVENLQIRLFDFHIRYEDNETLPQNFAFGMHISAISTETTDEKWDPVTYSKVNADKKWKKMALKNLSIYWDTNAKIFDDMTPDELIEAMNKCVELDDNVDQKQTNRFILHPVNGAARLTRVCSPLPLRSRNHPRLKLDVDLPEIFLNLAKVQYDQLLAWCTEVARWDTQKQHRSGRPTIEILKNPRAWWKWAINKHITKIQIRRKHRSLDFVLKRAKLNVDYVRKYKAYLTTKYVQKSPLGKEKNLETSMEELRTEFTFPELAILHELVYNELDSEAQYRQKKRLTGQKPVNKQKTLQIKKQSNQLRKQNWKWGGWLGRWRKPISEEECEDSAAIESVEDNEFISASYSKSPFLPDNVDDLNAANVPDSLFKDLDDEEIFEMFGDELSNEDTTDTFMKRDSVLLKLNFTLNNGKLLLQDKSNIGFVSLEFNDVNFKSEWRPRYSTHQIKLNLGSINLRDLNPLNAHFCDLITPSKQKLRPSSPCDLSPEVDNRKKQSDSWSSIFSFPGSKTETSSQDESESRENTAVLSITYEKLSHQQQFSDSLEVVTAPLCLTFVPGLTDKLKKFFQTPSTDKLTSKSLKNEMLTRAAKQRYDLWMQQTRAEVTNAVNRVIEGKEAPVKVDKRRWALSLDIFAPDIIIPENWSSPNSSMIVLSLGHMTFANHSDSLHPKEANAKDKQANGDEPVSDSDDDDDYMTPFATPPTEPAGFDQVDSQNQEMFSTEHFIDQEFLTERMLWDKMYDRYHVTFADLQVLVVPNRSKWESYRLGPRSPIHLIERFTVELTAERRTVPTLDPNYPALLLTGQLPHLTLHISHKKIHTALKCIHQLQEKYQTQNSTFNKQPRDPGVGHKTSKTKTSKASKATNEAKAGSKKLVCDFLINQISVVLEEEQENQIMSVLEVSRIQTKFVEKLYDSTISFSIYSLLLVDVMQQLGHDYELLLASHRRVYMDVDSGNILDSGTTSPEEPLRMTSTSSVSSTSGIHRPRRQDSKSGNLPTNSVLATVAESLRDFTKVSDQFFSPHGSDFVASGSKVTSLNEEKVQYLITLEIKSLRRGLSETKSQSNTPLEVEQNSKTYPYTDIKAKFNNLDVVFNAKSWITILNFLHKLKPVFPKPTSEPVFRDSNTDSQHDDHSMKNQPALNSLSDHNDLDEIRNKTIFSIDFKKLNILLLRHVSKFNSKVGRKISTVTMQGAHAVASFLPSKDLPPGHNQTVDVSGSIASLQMHDLTSTRVHTTASGYEILSVGVLDRSIHSFNTSDLSSDERKALSFNFTQSNKKTYSEGNPELGSNSKTLSSAPGISKPSPNLSSDSDTMLFAMDGEECQVDQLAIGFESESTIDIKLASTCYIHSPRLIAEILAFADEINDFIGEEMTSATRQAYREMARSIMEKVTDYSKSVLGRIPEESYDSNSGLVEDVCSLGITSTPNVQTILHPSHSTLSLQIKMQSPILGFPKFPGSFELLVANLGQITIRNDVNSLNPMDKLLIDVENMNLRSDRRREEEIAAKKTTDVSSKVSIPGPNISKLKKDSISFMRSLEEGTFENSKFSSTCQILHKTFLHFSVEKKNFVPTPKSSLDVRSCCSPDNLDHCSSNRSCSCFICHVGTIADTKMYVNVYAMSALTVTLSKQAYEQVLKTLDNISYCGDIDNLPDCLFLSTHEDPSSVNQSSSAPDLFQFNSHPPNVGNYLPKDLISTSSYQSTPKHSKQTTLFDLPELEIPQQHGPTIGTQNTVIRKYTPISADINIPCLIFQLSGDLSEGEQGIVKVTLERFAAAFKKENRFATQIDLSLGSLDIEDLLQPEESVERHIVVSSEKKSARDADTPKTVYLSASCPAFMNSNVKPGCYMSASLPSFQPEKLTTKQISAEQSTGCFRPYDSIHVADRLKKFTTYSQPSTPRFDTESSSLKNNDSPGADSTLVKITAFLVDGNSVAYSAIYNRVNRNIIVDFNSLDCKVNLQTWVVLLDFFGIGTSPKKNYQLDPETELTFSANQQLDVRSFYENQPDAMINSEINFTVRSFALTFNKQEYKLLKANVAGLQSQIQIRDAMLRVRGQLGNLSVSDLSPNGSFYRERFIFTGDKALDFDIKKFDDYDQFLKRDYDISVRLRMSSIRYVHTQRFQNETMAFCQHFQQLQEVLGRMRAASVGQSVNQTSRRQARVLLDIQADAPIILIPESSHSHRLLVANLGHITVTNSFKYYGDPGTLAHHATDNYDQASNIRSHNKNEDKTEKSKRPGCLLDVIYVNLIDMDLFTASFVKKSKTSHDTNAQNDVMKLTFPSYVVICNPRPLMNEKVKLELQMERNLEKEMKHENVPDTALSARLSSVYCSINHEQFWLIRGVLDHNAGETIPDFPQPTAFLQPSNEQTVLTGNVFTGLSMDFYLNNVSIELLKSNADSKKTESFGRLDFVKSKLSYRAFSDNTKTTNLSCEYFRAHDTRFQGSASETTSFSVFTTVLEAMKPQNRSVKSAPSNLQFELFYRTGPGYVEFTALLNNMRVYIIMDWLADMSKYLLENPNQERCNALRTKTAQLMHRFGQMDSGTQHKVDSSGHLVLEEQTKELKTNFTNTEFVLVQNTSRLDSDGVIIRCTAVFGYSPDQKVDPNSPTIYMKPIMSCSLQSLEVFSCQLNQENETALSIIDPVTINFEVRSIKQNDLSGEEILNDPAVLDKSLLDVQVSQLNIRVSYNDVMMFMNLFNSLTVNFHSDGSPKREAKLNQASRTKSVYESSPLVDPLHALGYSRRDVIQALLLNKGSVEQAGSWLVENAKLEENLQIDMDSPTGAKSIPLNVARLCLNADVFRLCLIDDCADDCDVPLTEMAVRNLSVRQAFACSINRSYSESLHNQKGSATFQLSGDYYNRMLSLWEPFLEPWRCNVSWRHTRGRSHSSAGRWNVEVQATDRFDITVTSALIDTVKKTTSTWRNDYARVNQSTRGSLARKRLPLVAYVLRNLTGSSLRFATQTATLRHGNTIVTGTSSSTMQVTSWQELLPGDEQSLNFNVMHEKQRHKRSESLTLHQIIVQVGEWNVFQPVTVSKVGVYFRHAFKQLNKSSSVFEPSLPVRVVFSVKLEGNAQKVVTVRSALAVRSRVKIPVQIQLSHEHTDFTMPTLEPGETQYMPLSFTHCPIKIRPKASSGIPYTYKYSSSYIKWQIVTDNKKEEPLLIECFATAANKPKFYFAVCIQRHPYPTYEQVSEMLQSEERGTSEWEGCYPLLPGHTIIILPPVVISNLLPCDLRYYIKNKDIEGALKPGLDATPHAVHVSPSNPTSLIVGCLIDGFQNCRELVIPAVVKNYQMRMVIKDWSNETLILNVRVFWRLACSVRVSIMAGYWVVNKSGLPIVIKQEGCTNLAAGQYDSHEKARSMQPLLFSYANREAPYLCTMRLGKDAQFDDIPLGGENKHLNGVPSFCERFSTDGGSCTRNLKLFTGDNSPNREFCIGVSVRRGWGRYLHTHIVTIAPRFLLINKTKSHLLNFAQRHATSFSVDSSGFNCHLAIIPGSSCVFHWPRVDLDTLLCVRLANELTCHWSGGFFIDRTDSFHIALRLARSSSSVALQHSIAPHCVFLTVEVTLVNATYCVVISDADPTQVPPPLRIDNVSFAPIIFKQVGTDPSFNTEVHPGSQLAYACDEPCLPHKITCSVKGDSGKVELDMDVIGEEKQLYYKNYFYIVIGSNPNLVNQNSLVQTSMVLDVQKGNNNFYHIILQPLRSGKRSQLWRMTSSGRVIHEGSSPPNDSTSFSDSSSSRSSGLVLDIAEVNVGRSFVRGIPLTLHRLDERRASTQTWSFAEDHRLKCRYNKLAVQVAELSIGQPVMLGSYDERRVCLPTEVCHLHKLIPGSGVLSLKVVRDGPTRVLRIVDIRQKRAGISHSDDWTVLESNSGFSLYESAHSELSSFVSESSFPTYNLSINMQQGVGISLISNSPEELLYVTMNGVNVNVSTDSSEQTLCLTMQKFQIDNQLLDGYPPVMLHPCLTASSQQQSSSQGIEPLISLRAVRQPTSSTIYEIYKSLSIDVGKLAIALEERLILKLFHFMGFNLNSSPQDAELLDETKVDSALSMTNLVDNSNHNAVKRYYFGTLRLSMAPVRLSVFTASRLTPELKALKQALAFPLIQFERAPVALQDYAKQHLFETMSFVFADLSKHVREQLKSQAAIILGSIDFLGNPIGLISDVKAGLHAGLGQGNVQNMTKHFTHGLSNTTAKFTGALSDKIGGLAMDEEYDDKRKAIQANARSSAGGHVVAGLQGLMAGVVGGLTSVVTQPVKGAQNDGASGFFKGVLKGVVGTVTKPVAGVLDLASESASAVRHISVSPDQVATRARPIRCCHSFQGCLQYYSKSQAEGQTFLYSINSNDFNEHFYSCDRLNFPGGDDILVLVTNKRVCLVKNGDADPEQMILSVDYSELLQASVIDSIPDSRPSLTSNNPKIYLELIMKSTSTSSSSKQSIGTRYHMKKPRVGCHSYSVAERLCQKIIYAKNLASEQTETMSCDPNDDIDDDRSFELEV